MKTIKCLFCNKEVEKRNSSNHLYCNRICYDNSRNKPNIKKKCLNCEKTIFTKTNKKFCSVLCSGKYNGKNGLVGGNMSSLDKFIELYGEKLGNEKYNNKSYKMINAKRPPSKLKGRKLTQSHKDKIALSLNNSLIFKNVNRKLTEEQRKNLSTKMKGTFTQDWFIKNYGNDLGNIKYQERCQKITESNLKKDYSKRRQSYSKMSQLLFFKIYESLDDNQNIYFAELNHEISGGTRYNFDFVDLNRKKIIEFNGDKFHANPKLYLELDSPNPYKTDLFAKDIWKKDKLKIQAAEKRGFNVMVVWEKDYLEDFGNILEKCLKFLNDE